MKFNLKNRPGLWDPKLAEWFDDFEKELREIKNAPEDWCDLFDELDDAESLIQELIREILGEKEASS